MKVIWHHHKLMQQVFVLKTIVPQNLDKKPRHSVCLKEALFLKSRSSDEVATVSSATTMRSGHQSPQRLKPILIGYCIAALEALRHPKAKLSLLLSRFGI